MNAVDYDLEEIKLLQTAYLKIYEIYFHWFTWFFGADVLSMSWVVSGSEHLHGIALRIVMAVWLLCAALGIGASWSLGRYTNEVAREFNELTAKKPVQKSAHTGLGLSITRYARRATALALALTFPAWILLLRYYG
jgi:hypothetical protein